MSFQVRKDDRVRCKKCGWEGTMGSINPKLSSTPDSSNRKSGVSVTINYFCPSDLCTPHPALLVYAYDAYDMSGGHYELSERIGNYYQADPEITELISVG